MIGNLDSDSRATRHMLRTAPGKGIAVGLAGGLAGTLVMDLFGVAAIGAMGGVPTISFSIIGDTTAGFLSMLGIDIAGGVPLGAALHYAIGLALGVIFGALVSRMEGFRASSNIQGMGLGIVFVEVVSLPLLFGAVIILKMTGADAALWFAMSFIMHGIYGAVLALVVRYGLYSPGESSPALTRRAG
jgi:hypothetical protein